jgi:hypothetical protein
MAAYSSIHGFAHDRKVVAANQDNNACRCPASCVVSSCHPCTTRTLTETNPLAAWLDERVVYEPDGRTYVGMAKQDPVTKQYEGANTWLYANYRDFADASGDRKAVSPQRFRRLMEDLTVHQLKLPRVA